MYLDLTCAVFILFFFDVSQFITECLFIVQYRQVPVQWVVVGLQSSIFFRRPVKILYNAVHCKPPVGCLCLHNVMPIARLLLQDLLHGTHFWLLFETLTHMLLSVVNSRLICSPYRTNSLCMGSAMLYTLCLEGTAEHRLSGALAHWWWWWWWWWWDWLMVNLLSICSNCEAVWWPSAVWQYS